MNAPKPYDYGKASEKMFVGVLPELVSVFRLGLKKSSEATPRGPDWSVVDGVRVPAQQAKLVQLGKSGTPKSAHLVQPSGFGEALDFRIWLGHGLNPFPLKTDSPTVVREKLARFEQAARFLFEAADEQGFPLQWGNDWDVDGIPTGKDPDEKGFLQDLVHFQKAPPHRLKQALERGKKRIELRAAGQSVIS